MSIGVEIRKVLLSLDDLIFVLDPDGVFLEYYQRSDSEYLYLPPEHFIGKNCRKVMPRHIWKPFLKAVNKIEKTRAAQVFEYLLMTPKGPLWFEAKATGIFDKEEKLEKIALVAREATKRKLSEKRLRERIETIKAMSKYMIEQEELLSKLRGEDSK